MKNILFIAALFVITLNSSAQNTNPDFVKDSSRIINLDEVMMLSKHNIPQRRLINFFKANNAATLEEILSRLPELSLTRRGAYGMEPAIRSFSAGQINVLVDGMRIHGACTDKMDPVSIYIEPLNLETLELQTGANGFSSGSTIGGTINMKLSEPDFINDGKITGVISSGYQTAAKSFFEAVRLNYASGRWALRGSATYRNSRNYRSGGGAKINFSQFEKINYSLSLKYLQTAHNYIKAEVLMDDGWNIGYPALPMDVGYANARIGSVSFVHENRNNKLSKILVKAYANKIKHFMDDTKRPNVPMHMDMPGVSETVGVFSEAEINIDAKQNLSLRADASSTYLKASMTMYQTGQLPMYMLTWPDNKKDQYGLSASYLWRLDSTLKMQINARADFMQTSLTTEEAKNQVSVFGDAETALNDLLKNFSVQFTKKINQQFKATASLAYTERLATAAERYGCYLFNAGDGYDYIGNPALKPETALQAEVSATYSYKRNRLQLTYFYNKLNNYIASEVDNNLSVMTIGANGVKRYLNISHATVTGLEASLFLKPAVDVDVVSTLRYTYTEDVDGNALPAIAPLKNIISVRYQPKKTFFQLETEIAAAQNSINVKAGEDKTPAYMLLHFRMGAPINLFGQNFELLAGVENIFDKKYHEHLDWGNITRPGINFYLQAKFAF